MPLGVEENGVRSCVPFLFIDQREGWDTIRSYLVSDNLKLDHVLLNPSMQISRDYGSVGLSITLFLRADGTLAVNRRLNGTPYRRPKSTPPLGCKV